MNLDDCNWKNYTIRDLFITKNNLGQQVPTGTYIQKKDLKPGTMPRITVTSQNNGIDGYYEYNDKMQISRNFISVSFLSTTFYHPYEASLDMKVHSLQLKDRPLNRFIAHFIISSLKESIADSSYGNQLSSTDIVRKTILLPAKDDGTPDYDFMEKYSQQLERNNRRHYREYAERQIAKLRENSYEGGQTHEWKAFSIKDLFTTERPNARNKDDYAPGDIPFVASGAENNGVMKHCSPKDEEKPDEGNCITVSPVDGTAFYQPTAFLGRGGAGSSIVILRSASLNKYNGVYLARCISNTCQRKYSYGRMGSQERVREEKIMLPTKNGEPDFEYMSDYAKSLMTNMYEKYVAYDNSLAS